MSETFSPRKEPEKPAKFGFIPPADKQLILGFSGKIGAGKTSHCNFIHALAQVHLLCKTSEAFVDERGKLIVLDTDNTYKEVNFNDQSPEAVAWHRQEIFPFIRTFSTAAPLKDFLHTFFGLSLEKLYGTQEEKNELTHLKWEDMPTSSYKDEPSAMASFHRKSGLMSYREVMEYYGTEVIRKTDANAHGNALAKTIKNSGTYICLVDDVRFEDEINSLRSIGGRVIRLTKVTEEAAKNSHISNTALDLYNNWDEVIDNHSLDMGMSFSKLMEVLIGWGWFERKN